MTHDNRFESAVSREDRDVIEHWSYYRQLAAQEQAKAIRALFVSLRRRLAGRKERAGRDVCPDGESVPA
jgi:hypothetical protein